MTDRVIYPNDGETRNLSALIQIFETKLTDPGQRVRVLDYLRDRYGFLYEEVS